MVNYERTAARRMLGKAYEKAGLADLDNKSWVLEKQQAFFSRLTPDNQTRWKQLAYENPDLAKQAYAEISSSDFNTINKIVQYMWSNMSTKEFDDMLSQVAQPKGGSENLTNVASPGQPPAKVTAVSDSKDGSTYGREAEVLGQPTGGFTDTRGRRSSTGAYAGYPKAPGAFVSGKEGETGYMQGTENPHQVGLSHGPVGDAGGNSRTDDYQATRPGDVGPGGSGYRQFPAGKIPSIPKNAGVSFTKVLDDSIYKTIPHDTNEVIELTPGKPNSHISYIGKAVRPLETAGIVSKSRRPIAGDYEGQAISMDGSDKDQSGQGGEKAEPYPGGKVQQSGIDVVGDPERNSPNRTFEPQNANSKYSTSEGETALNEAAKALRAKRLVERFLANKNATPSYLETKGDSFSQPIKITEEDDDEENTRLETLAEEEDEEALKDLKYGYTQSAMLHREKALRLRARMTKGYTTGNLIRKSLGR